MNTLRRVLIIDDCGVTTYFLRTHLSQLGFEVAAAGTGEEGIALAEKFQPDAIVLARKLPGMLGEALSLGADDFVVKPIKPEDIADRLDQAIGARRADRALETGGIEKECDGRAVVAGHVTPTLHAYLSARGAELSGHLKSLGENVSLTLMQHGSAEAAFALAREMCAALDSCEVLAFEAIDD